MGWSVVIHAPTVTPTGSFDAAMAIVAIYEPHVFMAT
jgi:hypothetical protein